MGEHVQVPLGR